VSIYNYFFKRFKTVGYEFIVRSNKLQESNKNPLLFDFNVIEFNFKKYRDEINKIKPDVVVLFLHLKELIYWQLVHWLKMKRIPIVYWNKAINYDDPGNKLKNAMFHYMHSMANAIILYSPYEKQNIKKKNLHKLFYANNTINYNDFPVVTLSKNEIKEELNIPFEKVVLFAGRMQTQGGRKKVDHLIKVFNEINRPDVGLVIVGSGMSEKTKNIINRKNTLYLGEVHDPQNDKISKIFAMADLFSIPGHIGLGINQAMYYGLPVVTEKGGQPPEINYLIDGVTGFLVGNNDVEALKEKIIYLIDNDEKRMEFSEKSKEHILKNASIDKMYAAFLNCCERLTKSRTHN
jgi:glycosyltransferase involved in cell wall biosynthesis